eukprot:COSAG02_NODE_913_length_15994_cov_6.140484_14_plen_23_part_01
MALAAVSPPSVIFRPTTSVSCRH